MTGDEDESQEVVAQVFIQIRVFWNTDGLFQFKVASHFFGLAFEADVAANEIDGMMLGGDHEPRAGFIGNAGFGPLLERGDERALRKILGETHIADEARKTRDESGGFDPPDCINGAMDIGKGHGLCLKYHAEPLFGEASLLPKSRLFGRNDRSLRVTYKLSAKDFVDLACAVASDLPETP